tara:strand:- start:110 stop:640 length:531 start_codon:yes stop_codon:yes gene_type:complete
MAKDRFGYQNTPPSYAISNPFSGNKFNTAKGVQVFEEPSGETNPVSEEMKGKVVHPSSKNISDFGTADFDVTDHNEVLKLQKSLGLKEDGIFGPKTEAAYRNMVNERRAAQGKDVYHYDDPRRPEPPIPSQVVPQNPDPILEGYLGQEYGPEEQPIMMRNKPEESKSLWDMIRGMF